MLVADMGESSSLYERAAVCVRDRDALGAAEAVEQLAEEQTARMLR
jgi:hypothetical protein